MAGKDYIAHIAYAFEDPLFSDWFQTSQTYYGGLSFAEFMNKIRSHWLAAGWEKDLAHKVHNSEQGSTSFCDFAMSIHHDNLLLKNTKYHLSPLQLHTQIESNLSHELLSAYDHYKEKHNSDSDMDNENDALGDDDATAAAESAAQKAENHLEVFIQLLIRLDDKVHEESASCQKEAEDALWKLKHSGSTAGLSESSCKASNTHAGQQLSTQSGSVSMKSTLTTLSASQGHPPKLTECEHQYLGAHSGCKKCCNFYMAAGHACEFPRRENYIERNMNTVNVARTRLGLVPLPVPSDKISLPVASISTMIPPAPSTILPVLPVAAVMGMTAYPVASIGHPNNTHNMLMDGVRDLSRDSNDSVSNYVPFCVPHLVWHCAIDDPSSSTRLHVEALIDHGSPIVLINQKLVSLLQLHARVLPQPLSVSTAFFDNSTAASSTPMNLTHWVKLKLHDRKIFYSAWTVRMLIASNLCHNIILSLPLCIIMTLL